MDKYAVIGNPVSHSRSPEIHQRFAQQSGIEISYEKIESALDNFSGTLDSFYAAKGKGCNITVPFKEQAFQLATKLGSNAKKAQSVNCIKFLEDGTIYGDNFDGVGLVEDLIKNKHLNLKQQTILILGAGGAARGIIEPLLAKAPSSITLVNRTFDKAKLLAENFSDLGTIHAIPLKALTPDPFSLIINATSAGHTGKVMPLPKKIIATHTICYDLSYGIAATPFLSWCKLNGCTEALDGFGMLVEQAAASFYLWTNYYPNTEEILK